MSLTTSRNLKLLRYAKGPVFMFICILMVTYIALISGGGTGDDSDADIRPDSRRINRLIWPEGNYSCYTEETLSVKAARGPLTWEDWMKAYCAPVPVEVGPTGRIIGTNMTKALHHQLKCLDRGFNAINMPWVLTGGQMLGVMRNGTLNTYEMDNDVVVPSWFDFEALQDYWAGLPEADECRKMFIFAPEGNPFRICNGIRGRATDCPPAVGGHCGRMYRPYSDLYIMQSSSGTTDDFYLYDVSSIETGVRSLDAQTRAMQTKIGRMNYFFSRNPTEEEYLKLTENFRSLFEDGVLPFVGKDVISSETEAAVAQELFQNPAHAPKSFSTGHYEVKPRRSPRKVAFERVFFARNSAYIETFPIDGVNLSVLKKPLMEFTCHLHYGFDRWRSPPHLNKDVADGYYKDIATNCNSVYADKHNTRPRS